VTRNRPASHGRAKTSSTIPATAQERARLCGGLRGLRHRLCAVKVGRMVAGVRRIVTWAGAAPLSSRGDSRRPPPQPQSSLLALHTLGWSAYLITSTWARCCMRSRRPTSRSVLAAAAGGFLLSRRCATCIGVSGTAVRPGRPGRAVRVLDRRASGWRVIINSSYLHWSTPSRWPASRGTASSSVPSARPTCCCAGRGCTSHQVLRGAAGTARIDAACFRARTGSPGEDAAVPAEPALPVQHAECHLDADLDNQGKIANQAVGRLSDFLRYTSTRIR